MTSSPARTVPRALLIIAGPLLLTFVAFIHPKGADLAHNAMEHTHLWLAVHVLQIPLFALVALSLFLLTLRGTRRGSQVVVAVGAAFFVVFYTAMDALAGIASGVLAVQAHGRTAEDAALVAELMAPLNADFSDPFTAAGWPAFTVTVLGGLGWVCATVGAAINVRRTGAPFPAALLIGLGAIYLMHDMPTAPFAMGSLLIGVVWIQVWDLRRRRAGLPG